MNKKKIISLLALTLGATTILASCGDESTKISINDKGNLVVDGKEYVPQKGEKGEPGTNGTNGNDGHTPVITVGENGNWFVDGVDTNQKAQGAQGDPGTNGDNGLSNYELYKKYHPLYEGTEEEWINALASGDLANSYDTEYNIIFTLATVPPVLSALDAIYNGYETYAFIERGKTYNGIDDVYNFHNIGFDKNSNNSSGFNNDQFNLVVNKVKELNVYGNEKFNIYVQDGTALSALAIAANAELTDNQFEIIMVEDGTGAYEEFNNNYLAPYNITADNDAIYNNYADKVKEAEKKYNDIYSKNDNNISDQVFNYNIGDAFAYAALDNFTYWLQDENQIIDMLEAKSNGTTHTALLSSFGVTGYDDDVDYYLNLRYKSIKDYVNDLSDDEKTDYLTLMYGSYYEDTYNTLTRTTLSDGITDVPSDKLVFIGSRVNGYPKIASSDAFGVGGATSIDDIPNDYASLADKYKTPLLFGSEEDYLVLLNILNDDENYDSSITSEQKDAVKVACFNYYIDYMMTLKFTYAMYGDEFDIIMKGHPREVIGAYTEWSAHYEASGYRYDKLMDLVTLAFHNEDSIGKFIGMVPYGTAAENLAYLGANISIAGLPSSTYTGYDPDVDVQFVISLVDTAIDTDSNLKSRYELGNLTYTYEDSIYNTKFINNGNMYLHLYKIYKNYGLTELANSYKEMYTNWLKTVLGKDDVSNYSVNEQGFIDERN